MCCHVYHEKVYDSSIHRGLCLDNDVKTHVVPNWSCIASHIFSASIILWISKDESI